MSTAAPLPARVLALLNALRPAPQAVNARERLRVVLGAGIGLLLAGLLSRSVMPAMLPWLVAPLGASAVLVFGVPASPLAQPWAVVGGNTVSALVGIACMKLLPLAPLPTAAIAVALAIGLMFLLRCLHPPGGAASLLMVLTATHDWSFALEPVALNSVLLVLAGMAYNTATGRRYPHAQLAPTPSQGAQLAPPRFGDAELDAVLARYNQVLDVPRDDLAELLHEAELLSYRNRLRGLRCADIMSAPVITVEFGTPLAEAWALLQQHRIKALPVVDRVRRIVGIVTRADFIRTAAGEQREGLAGRLQTLLKASPTTHSAKPEVVGQIMSRQVRVASADRPIAELVPLFSATGHHHIPIVGEQARLVGILTQSDLVKALSTHD
ncbi:HPP family protein [Roseateles cellulosilyticus]|uniref:HPP family protein n=1 Tax=Pelomonas cellulosilytica TaxID=2906762 RepID=A0ABS8XWG1_9BURK|nr:HPP family protein [Pelomonas sp. P8]MCE4553635.1 HPP family protein [Pelomonas sp. P8]